MKILLEGKRAFISAGGNGIGRSTCLTFHELGAEVYTCDLDHVALSKLPAGIHHQVCDVGDPKQVDQLMQGVMNDGLDILVNNAGIAGPTAPVENVSVRQWHQTIAVCLDAQFYFVRKVVPHFKKKQAGVIINLISTAGIMGFPNRSPYAAAKWAVAGFTKTLAMELGPDQIRVNGIAPGSVNGDRMNRVIRDHAIADNIEEDLVRKLYAMGTSMQCYVNPEEIAEMIAYLCSDYGRHISGQIIGIDGHTETLCPRLI